VCDILAMFSTKRPETVNFRFYVAKASSNTTAPGRVMSGYTLDAGDIVYANGLPNHAASKEISDSAFTSESFSSAGRLYAGPFSDGGIGASTNDGPTMTAFFTAFLSGKYQISFRENGVEGLRAYNLNAPIPVDVAGKFDTCMSRLGISRQ
jgi:hypothetical protein